MKQKKYYIQKISILIIILFTGCNKRIQEIIPVDRVICKDPQTYPKDKTNKTAYVPGKKYKSVQKTNYPSSPSNA